MATPKLAVVILAYNEELNLPRCLASLRGLAHADVFIVDSGSTDRTLEVAASFGATVRTHPFVNYAAQFNWALSCVPDTYDWIMRLDADEWLTAPCAERISRELGALDPGVTALCVRRRLIFLGKWIRWGGIYPIWLLRLWRNGAGRCEDRSMDEHIVVSGGRILRLPVDIVDENRKGLEFWMSKHLAYARRELNDIDRREQSESHRELTGQALRRRFLKEKVFWRLPRIARGFGYWAFRYFCLLGFLDGKEGLLFHFFHALWYRTLVDAELLEREKQAAASAVAGSAQLTAGASKAS